MIDILIAHKNHSNYLIKQLDALNQALDIIGKIIIVDDYSNEIHKINIQKFNGLNKVQVYNNESEPGMQNAYNLALKYSESEYLYYASCDDELNPDFLRIGCQKLEDYSQIDIFVSEINEVYYQNDVPVRVNNSKFVYHELTHITPEEYKKLYAKGIKYFSGGATIYRSNFIKKLGGYITNLGLYSDIYPQVLCGLTKGFLYYPIYASSVKIKEDSYNVGRANNWNLRRLDGFHFITLLNSHFNLKTSLGDIKIGDLTSSYLTCISSNKSLFRYFKPTFKNLLLELLSFLK
jgi:glycosyltransferase involved in cell wall biosynthesis